MYCKLCRSYLQAYGDTFTVIWYCDHEREMIIKSDFYKKFLFEIVDMRFLWRKIFQLLLKLCPTFSSVVVTIFIRFYREYFQLQ